MKKARHCDLESFVLLSLFFERLKELLCLQDELNDLFYMLYLAGICSNESAGETVLLENEVEKVDYVS